MKRQAKKWIVISETGYMFSGSYEMMQLYSDNKKDYSKIISIMGRYFQIRDDYCNLIHQEVIFIYT